MQETQVPSLVQEDPLEKGMATHSNILAWRIPWIEEPGRLQSKGSQRVRHDRVTRHANMHALRQNKLENFKNWSSLIGSPSCTISSIRFRSKFTIMTKQKIGSKEHLHWRFNIWYLFKTRLVRSVHLPYFPSCLRIQISHISLLMLEIPLSRNREKQEGQGTSCKTAYSMKERCQAEPSWHSDSGPQCGSPDLAHTMTAITDPYLIWP